MARAVDVIHRRGYAHGDIHANNVLIHQQNVHHVYVIDFDNFAGKSLPVAPCLGHSLYMAPEIRVKHANPSIEADRFSLSVLLHEILTLRHPVPNEASLEQFNEAMAAGKWLGDPACQKAQSPSAGYPAEILDADLSRLFRAGISNKPALRPTATQWQDALFASLFRVFICPACSGPNLVDVSKKRCALCGETYPTLSLVGDFGRLELIDSSNAIGRATLGGSTQVSQRHAVIRRVGPEYRIEDCSSNGVFRKTASGWIRLPKCTDLARQPVLCGGDQLRFANVEAQVRVA